MKNDADVTRIAVGSVFGKKGAGAFNKFQGRIKNVIDNLDFEPEKQNKALVWDKLRRKK